MRDEPDGKFLFKVNIISILPKPFQLLHEWVLIYFKYQYPSFYYILFDDSEKWPFEVSPGCTKTLKIHYMVFLSCIFCNAKIVLVCSVHCHLDFLFVGDKNAADSFQDEVN